MPSGPLSRSRHSELGLCRTQILCFVKQRAPFNFHEWSISISGSPKYGSPVWYPQLIQIFIGFPISSHGPQHLFRGIHSWNPRPMPCGAWASCRSSNAWGLTAEPRRGDGWSHGLSRSRFRPWGYPKTARWFLLGKIPSMNDLKWMMMGGGGTPDFLGLGFAHGGETSIFVSLMVCVSADVHMCNQMHSYLIISYHQLSSLGGSCRLLQHLGWCGPIHFGCSWSEEVSGGILNSQDQATY